MTYISNNLNLLLILQLSFFKTKCLNWWN